MGDVQSFLFHCVLDASSLIQLERSGRRGMRVLRTRNQEVVITRRVADEVTGERASPLTRFITRYPHVVVELDEAEERLFLMALQVPGMDPGEASAIAVAMTRRMTLVCEDGPARRLARQLNLRLMDWQQFAAGQLF